MPRDSTGTYVAPANTSAVSKQTISATAFNTLETDIGAEITNSVDRLGRSAMQASLPMGGNKITGMADPSGAQDAVTINYLNSTFSPSPSRVVGWLGYTPANKAGDTFLGAVLVAPASGSGAVYLSKTSNTGMANVVYGQTSGVLRWAISLGEGTTESGGNAGSNFSISTFTDAGSSLATPFTITRSTGLTTITAGLTVQNGFTSTGASSFTTTVTAPTPSPGDNSTNVATTAFVQAAPASVAFGAIGSYCSAAGPINTVPGGTVSGASLTVNAAQSASTFSVSGTWRYMGSSSNQVYGELWLRIS